MRVAVKCYHEAMTSNVFLKKLTQSTKKRNKNKVKKTPDIKNKGLSRKTMQTNQNF